MPFWLVKFSLSPANKPDEIDTVAPLMVDDWASVRVRAASSGTAGPPTLKVAVSASVTTGGEWTVRVKITVFESTCRGPFTSVTRRLTSRLSLAPALVGSAALLE